MRRRQPKNAIDLLAQRFGIMKAAWILQFLAMWAAAMRANGWQPIGAEQYARHWEMSRAKGFRDRQRWGDLFPDLNPNELVAEGYAEYDRLMADDPKPDVLAAFMATHLNIAA